MSPGSGRYAGQVAAPGAAAVRGGGRCVVPDAGSRHAFAKVVGVHCGSMVMLSSKLWSRKRSRLRLAIPPWCRTWSRTRQDASDRESLWCTAGLTGRGKLLDTDSSEGRNASAGLDSIRDFATATRCGTVYLACIARMNPVAAAPISQTGRCAATRPASRAHRALIVVRGRPRPVAGASAQLSLGCTTT